MTSAPCRFMDDVRTMERRIALRIDLEQPRSPNPWATESPNERHVMSRDQAVFARLREHADAFGKRGMQLQRT